MAPVYHNDSIAILDSQPMLRQGEFESGAVKAQADRTKSKPHGMQDSVHVDPEHVWGDEGPVNE